MYQHSLHPLPEAASNLGISVALIQKFIKKGLIIPIEDDKAPKLTAYGLRRLMQVVDLYEKSYPMEKIERLLNN